MCKVTLNSKQQDLHDAVVNDKQSVFFTGCGGTGKTFVTKYIIEKLKVMYPSLGSVAVTASTGRAAFNIGGVTIHSFSGIGLGTESAHTLAMRISKAHALLARWKAVRVLVIDEISMISGELFDKLEHIARVVRKSNLPFGGIQLVLVGDLLQLPPVSTNTRVKRVFQSSSWASCIKKYIRLDSVFRQSDMEFIRTLTCIRVGAITEEVVGFMERLCERKDYRLETEPTNLFSKREKADRFNYAKLSKLQGDIMSYSAIDKLVRKSGSIDSLLSSCPAPATLELKVGAQVMLIKNLSKDLVNGTVGIVTKFAQSKATLDWKGVRPLNSSPVPIVRFTMANGKIFTRPIGPETWETTLPDGTVQCSRTQVPLILAWAITIHKSQGQTIQQLRVDLEGIFESGQVYTALSRAVSIDTLEIVNFSPDTIKTDSESLTFCMDNDLI